MNVNDGFQTLVQRGSRGAFAMALLIALPAAADDGVSVAGIITAASYGRLPSPAVIHVRPTNDTADMQALKTRIEAELRASGLSQKTGAALRLSFDVESHETVTGKHEPSLGTLNLGGGARSGLHLNVWSPTHDSLLGGRQSSGAVPQVEMYNHLGAVLEDQQTGKRLWETQITYRADRTGQDMYLRGAVTALVENFGKTVREQSFAGP